MKIILFLFLTLSLFSKEKVLILHSYHENLEWTKALNNGINSVIKKRYKSADFFVEYMDTKRHDNETHNKNIYNILHNKYKKTKFDLIISSDNNAFDFIKKYNKTLFNAAPVVFTGVNYVKKEDTLGYKNFTGINQIYDLEENYKLIKKLHPNVENIVTIVDSTVTGNVIKNEIRRLYKKYKDDNINYKIIQNVNLEDLKKEIINLSKNSVILFTIFYRSKDNVFYRFYEIPELISSLTKSPVYGVSEIFLEHGVIGGYLTSGFYHGKKAALIGVDILNGKKVENIPIDYKSSNKYIFNYESLIAYGININDLPKNSVIVNKPSTLYELYKFEITILFLVFIVLVIFVIILLRNLKVLKKAESKIHDLNKTLEKKVKIRTSELAKTNTELNNVINNLKLTQNKLVESEKMASLGGLVAGIAHEINTPIGISVTGISHLLDITKEIEESYLNNNLVEKEFKEYIETSNTLTQLINVNLGKTAELVKSFKQIAVDQTHEEKRKFNLNEYLENIIFSLNNIIKKTNITINKNCSIDLMVHSYAGAYSQILTNLILNSIKHAYAKNEYGCITISIYKKNKSLYIIYEDDGNGISKKNLPKIFDPFFTTNRNNGGTGLGLNIIYNLVTSNLNGTINCESTEKEGVQFTISLPFDEY